MSSGICSSPTCVERAGGLAGAPRPSASRCGAGSRTGPSSSSLRRGYDACRRTRAGAADIGRTAYLSTSPSRAASAPAWLRVRDAELAQDRGDVVVDGLLGEEQPLGDLARCAGPRRRARGPRARARSGRPGSRASRRAARGAGRARRARAGGGRRRGGRRPRAEPLQLVERRAQRGLVVGVGRARAPPRRGSRSRSTALAAAGVAGQLERERLGDGSRGHRSPTPARRRQQRELADRPARAAARARGRAPRRSRPRSRRASPASQRASARATATGAIRWSSPVAARAPAPRRAAPTASGSPRRARRRPSDGQRVIRLARRQRRVRSTRVADVAGVVPAALLELEPRPPAGM